MAPSPRQPAGNRSRRCWSFGAGEHSSLGAADNVASSIRVQDGYAVTVFSNANYDGALHTLLSSSADASGWSQVGRGNASSLIVQVPETLAGYSVDGVTPSAAGETRGPAGPTSSTASGCWHVWHRFTSVTHYKKTGFTYGLETRFCTKGGKITKLYGTSITANVGTFFWPFNGVNSWRYDHSFFIPGEAGATSTRLKVQGVVKFCIFNYGCLTSHTHWIVIDLRGDGSAMCSDNWVTRAWACKRASA